MPSSRSIGSRRRALGGSSRTSPHLARARRPLQVAVLCTLVGATLSATGGTAQAVPEQVLQSVQVQIAPDGTITAVESQAVRKAGDADPTSEVEHLQPTEVAGDLPVRVLTSYRLGERSGTDLRDIEGEAGRVVIEVTVQNTTVRPEELSYQTSDGDTRTATALVGTPLTVVGSAQLGEGEPARIVTSNDVAPDEVTDGVVSRGEDGRTRVQWAAMLAPPRLAPSATFTLVEETTDFEVPTFDLSVQPGLVTDTSLSQLIDSAFSEDGDSTLQLESRTISIIGSVNTVLAEAGGVLDDIATTLDRSAGDLGRRTVSELRAGRDGVDRSLTSTISELERLDGDIEAELERTGGETLSRLDTTLDRVRQMLGDPRTERVPELRFSGGCTDRVPNAEPGLAPADTPRSVLYRMRLVGAQLKALTKVSGACTERIQRGLRATIGKSGDCAGAKATTAICTLEATIVELGERTGEITDFGAELKELADPDDAIGALRTRLATVSAEVVRLQGMRDEVAEGGLLAGQLVKAARDIERSLEGLKRELGRLSLQQVLAGYGQISEIAEQQLALLGGEGEGGAGSVTGQLGELTDLLVEACGTLQPDDLPEGLTTELIALLTGSGGACKDVDDLVESLDGKLDDLTGAWTRVADLTDLGDGSDSAVKRAVDAFAGDLADVTGQVDLALAQVEALLEAGEGSDDGEHTLTTLLDGLEAVYDPGLPLSTCDDPAPGNPAKRPLVNQLEDALGVVDCNSQELLARIDGRMARFTQVVGGARDDVADRRDETDRARQAAEDEVAALTGMLSRRIDDAGRDVGRRVRDKVARSRAQLSEQERTADAVLAQLTREASARLSRQVGSSTRDLGGTNRQLQRNLAGVLLDLGTRGADGTGILGTLSSSARRTGLSNADLEGAAQEASAFRSIRGQVVSDIRLQQAQTDRSLQLAAQFPSLGLDLPPGSRVLTVFSFHVGG